MATQGMFHNGYEVGVWKLSKVIARGGQGEVWEVRSQETPHAPARALKLCTATDAPARARFEREVKLLRSVEHPSVIRVFDSNIEWALHEKAQVHYSYFVMEKFDASLSKWRWIHGAPVFSLRLFRDTCQAVEALHSNNIIHRDLKPANVLVGGEYQHAVIADLGIAYAPTEEDKLTKATEALGTPNYRAPEVASGQRGDERSDVYGLGRILEWMLTGREPDEPTPRAIPESGGLSAAARAHFDTVIRTACSFDPQQRYRGVSQLVAALPEVVGDIATREPVVAHLSSSLTPAAAYERARECLRAKDVVGWRDIQKAQRRQLGERLVAWRARHAGARTLSKTDLLSWANEAVEDVGQVIAENLAAAEFPSLLQGRRPAELVRDVLTLSEWNESGLTVLVKFPHTLAYLAHHLLGAVGVAVGDVPSTIELAFMSVDPSSRGPSPLLLANELVGWPASLGGEADTAWKFLSTLPSRHQWISDPFGSEDAYRVSLVAYVLRLSFFEFARLVAAGHFSESTVLQSPFLCVPPLWLGEDRSAILRAFDAAFPNASTVRELASHSKALEAKLSLAWPNWNKLLRTAFASTWRNGLFFRDLPELPPLPL